jgi:hypothetical protein
MSEARKQKTGVGGKRTTEYRRKRKLRHSKLFPAGHVFSAIRYSISKMGEIDGWLLVSGSRGELPCSPVSICHLSSDICPLFSAN